MSTPVFLSAKPWNGRPSACSSSRPDNEHHQARTPPPVIEINVETKCKRRIPQMLIYLLDERLVSLVMQGANVFILLNKTWKLKKNKTWKLEHELKGANVLMLLKTFQLQIGAVEKYQGEKVCTCRQYAICNMLIIQKVCTCGQIPRLHLWAISTVCFRFDLAHPSLPHRQLSKTSVLYHNNLNGLRGMFQNSFEWWNLDGDFTCKYLNICILGKLYECLLSKLVLSKQNQIKWLTSSTIRMTSGSSRTSSAFGVNLWTFLRR